MTGKIDVAQLVLRSEIDGGTRFFLARRSRDGYWEWIGGKREEGESIEEAAVRELKEEINIDWNEEFHIVMKGESYLSQDDDKYRLNPVLIDISSGAAERVSKKSLSREHDEFQWIKLTEFDEFETLGQYKALEKLDLVNGRVVLSTVMRNEEVLMVKRSQDNSTPGKWGLVSGRIEEGESTEEAAVRELGEETGLEAEVVKKGDYYINEAEYGFWRLEPVLMEYDSGNIDLNWELSDYRWIKPSETSPMDKIGEMKAFNKLDLV